MEIADVVGIEFNLTHHFARKTFASTVLLYNNVPMEHKQRKTLQKCKVFFNASNFTFINSVSLQY